jgi:hypothetical protein
VRAVGLHSAVAILIAGTGVGLAVGSANAETAAPAELEAPDSADSGVRDATPTAQRAEQRRERRELRSQQAERRGERRGERRELRSQRREERLVHARAVLFDGIELSAEQSRGVDAIIEAELKFGQRHEELQAEFETAHQQDDTEDLRAIRAEAAPLLARRRGPNECMEEMRVLLSEEQRPIFDMNRARLAAEGQEPEKKKPRRRKPRAGAEVKAERAGSEVKAEGADAEVKAE